MKVTMAPNHDPVRKPLICFASAESHAADALQACDSQVSSLGATMVGDGDYIFADACLRVDPCGLRTYVLEYTDGTVNEYADLGAMAESVSSDRAYTISEAIEMATRAPFADETEEAHAFERAYQWILAALGSPDDMYRKAAPEDVASIMATNDQRLEQALVDSQNVPDDLLVYGELLRSSAGERLFSSDRAT